MGAALDAYLWTERQGLQMDGKLEVHPWVSKIRLHFKLASNRNCHKIFQDLNVMADDLQDTVDLHSLYR